MVVVVFFFFFLSQMLTIFYLNGFPDFLPKVIFKTTRVVYYDCAILLLFFFNTSNNYYSGKKNFFYETIQTFYTNVTEHRPKYRKKITKGKITKLNCSEIKISNIRKKNNTFNDIINVLLIELFVSAFVLCHRVY